METKNRSWIIYIFILCVVVVVGGVAVYARYRWVGNWRTAVLDRLVRWNSKAWGDLTTCPDFSKDAQAAGSWALGQVAGEHGDLRCAETAEFRFWAAPGLCCGASSYLVWLEQWTGWRPGQSFENHQTPDVWKGEFRLTETTSLGPSIAAFT